MSHPSPPSGKREASADRVCVSYSVWGISDGARLANVDAEIVAYSVLDILAKPVFGFWLLTTHDAMSRSSISVDGFWANGIAAEGAIRVGDDA